MYVFKKIKKNTFNLHFLELPPRLSGYPFRPFGSPTFWCSGTFATSRPAGLMAPPTGLWLYLFEPEAGAGGCTGRTPLLRSFAGLAGRGPPRRAPVPWLREQHVSFSFPSGPRGLQGWNEARRRPPGLGESSLAPRPLAPEHGTHPR